MMRKQKRDYKSHKVLVAVDERMKTEIENMASSLGIGEAALLRLAFKMLLKRGPLSPQDLVNEG